MGWYLKRGFLECMYNGTEDPLIRIEDDAQVSIVDDSPVETLKPDLDAKEQAAAKQALENAVPEVKENDLSSLLDSALQQKGSNLDDLMNGFFKVQQNDATTPIDVEKAKENLKRMLGEDVPM